MRDPITIPPEMRVGEVIELTRAHRISGLPVIDAGGHVVGIVTNRDLRFETRLDIPVKEIMTPRERLVTVPEGATLEEAKALMHRHRLERVVVIDDNFVLRGLVTVKDITRTTEHPLAAKDELGKLRVGAAVGTGDGEEERVAALVQAGVDVVVVDTAHGHTRGVLDRVRWIKRTFPTVDVIGGNIATGEAALALVEHGAEASRWASAPVRSAPPVLSRVSACRRSAPLTAWRGPWRAAACRSWPMAAYAIRATWPRPWPQAPRGDDGQHVRRHRGGARRGGALQGRLVQGVSRHGQPGRDEAGAADRYFQDNAANVDKLVPEGIEGRVPFKGSIVQIVFQLAGGVRSSMGYCGCRTIDEMRSRAEFVEITNAGMRESTCTSADHQRGAQLPRRIGPSDAG